jgi:hypothetical protein
VVARYVFEQQRGSVTRFVARVFSTVFGSRAPKSMKCFLVYGQRVYEMSSSSSSRCEDEDEDENKVEKHSLCKKFARDLAVRTVRFCVSLCSECAEEFPGALSYERKLKTVQNGVALCSAIGRDDSFYERYRKNRLQVREVQTLADEIVETVFNALSVCTF